MENNYPKPIKLAMMKTLPIPDVVTPEDPNIRSFHHFIDKIKDHHK